MEPKFSRKSIALIASGAVVLAGAGIGVFALNSNQGAGPEPVPTSSTSPTGAADANPTPPAEVAPTIGPEGEVSAALIESTTQHLEGSASLVAQASTVTDVFGGEGAQFPGGLTMPALWTVQEYIDGAIANPYFVSDWWGTKDSNKPTGPEEYFFKFVSPEVQQEFLSQAEQVASGTPDEDAEAWLAARMFRPADGLEVRESCYDIWDEGACWADDDAVGLVVTSATATPTSATTINVKVNLSVDVQYQHPELTDGSIASQERLYELDFDLEYKNAPAADKVEDTENPYMVITRVDGKVSNGQVEDFLLISDLPPPPPVDQ